MMRRSTVKGLHRYVQICAPFGLISLLILGCTSLAYRPAERIIPDAHSGGTALAFDDGATILASGGRYGRPTARWRAHDADVRGILFVPDGRILTSGIDGTIAAWTRNGRLIKRIDTGSPVSALALDASDGTLLAGHWDGSVRRYSAAVPVT